MGPSTGPAALLLTDESRSPGELDLINYAEEQAVATQPPISPG